MSGVPCSTPNLKGALVQHFAVATQEVGGLSCCKHGHFILDKAQTSPAEIQEYQLKMRIYFQECPPALHANC